MINIGPKEMMLDTEVLGSHRKLLVGSKKIGTLIIFKDSTMDFGLGRTWKIKEIKDTSDHAANRDQSSKCIDKSNVFSM